MARISKNLHLADQLLIKLFRNLEKDNPEFSHFSNQDDENYYLHLSKQIPHLVPDFMKDLYQQYPINLGNVTINIEGRERHLGVIDIVQSQRLLDIKTWPIYSIHKLIFKPLQKSLTHSIVAKELRLHQTLFSNFVKFNDSKLLYFIIIKIYDVNFKQIRQKIVKKEAFSKDGWISVDIKNLSESVFYLKIDSLWSQKQNRFQRKISGIKLKVFQTEHPYYANLVTFYQEIKKRRVSNSKKSTFENSNDNNHVNLRIKRSASSHYQEYCQRRPLIVSFEEVGWHRWIIAPKEYNAYYCKGSCPFPLSDSFNVTNHAIIQLLVHSMKDISIPKPCCVPYQLSSTTLLYFNNDGQVLLRKFEDMEVDSCSCR